MVGDSKLFTFSQVCEHNKRRDCWLIINGKVYDVSSFMEEHPGGEELMLTATGHDATDEYEDVHHTPSAKARMPKLCIGEIDASTMPKINKSGTRKQSFYNQDKPFESIIKLLQFVVPIATLGVAAGIHVYTKST